MADKIMSEEETRMANPDKTEEMNEIENDTSPTKDDDTSEVTKKKKKKKKKKKSKFYDKSVLKIELCIYWIWRNSSTLFTLFQAENDDEK